MKRSSFRAVFASAAALAAMMFVGSGKASADVINFEQFSGPCCFAFAGPEQTLNILTSIGNVSVSGGVILTNTSNLPADETSVYGTAFFGDASLLSTITLVFPENINNFFLNLYNGETFPDVFTASDNLGNSTTVTLDSNLNGGNSLISFPAAGNVVTITTTDRSWDFFVDNIGFNQPTPGVPEPTTMMLFGSGLVGLVGKLRRRLKAKS